MGTTIKDDDYLFWTTEGINYVRWSGAPVYYEGEDNVDIVVSFVGDTPMRDLACGYGRYAPKFNPANYVGYDICEAAVNKARRMFSKYKFKYWNITPAPAPVTLVVNTALTISDDALPSFISSITADTKRVILSEPMIGEEGRLKWIYQPYKCYTRNIEDYDEAFKLAGFTRTKTHIGVHKTLNVPYTIGRWDAI